MSDPTTTKTYNANNTIGRTDCSPAGQFDPSGDESLRVTTHGLSVEQDLDFGEAVGRRCDKSGGDVGTGGLTVMPMCA
jgi:hypothetical protein